MNISALYDLEIPFLDINPTEMFMHECQRNRYKDVYSSIMHKRLSESNLQNEKCNKSPRIVVRIKYLQEVPSVPPGTWMYL